MADEIQSNPYFKEALSYVDDELLKYQGDEQLTWWAQAIVGLFQDLVDVEAISAISDVRYFTEIMQGDPANNFALAWWDCGGNEAFARLWPTLFVVINSTQQCTTAEIIPSSSKTMLKYLHCAVRECGYLNDLDQKALCIGECMPPPDGTQEALDCSQTCSAQTENCADCLDCCPVCFPTDLATCQVMCHIDFNCFDPPPPCYFCDHPPLVPVYP